MARGGRNHPVSEVPAMQGGDGGPSHVSASIRQIENGFISSHSSEGPDGYHTRERFHANRPSMDEVLGHGRKEAKPPEGKHLKGAVALLKRGRA